MAIGAQPKSAADLDLRLQELDHFTVPVRDFNVARKFYSEVLGGIVTQEPLWYRVPHRSREGIGVGGHACLRLFDGAGHMVFYYQPWGQPGPDQMHPSRVFAASNPRQVDDIIVRLEQANVPFVLMTPEANPGATEGPAQLYFRDPDGNQLSVACPSYPLTEQVQVGPFDPFLQQYRWRDWRALVPDGGPPAGMAQPSAGRGERPGAAPAATSAGGATAEEAAARSQDPMGWRQGRRTYGEAEGPWSVDGLDRFTLAVRDVERAELFYRDVMGAEIVDREAVEVGGRPQEALRVRACAGVELSLVQQDYGWLPVDSSNPHWGFAISPADVESWLDHFADWRIPCALIVRRDDVVPQGVPTRVELHLLDPDGNQLELVAWGYPLSDRVQGTHYTPWSLSYSYDSWPPTKE